MNYYQTGFFEPLVRAYFCQHNYRSGQRELRRFENCFEPSIEDGKEETGRKQGNCGEWTRGDGNGDGLAEGSRDEMGEKERRLGGLPRE